MKYGLSFISAFLFESYLGQIKNIIRSPYNFGAAGSEAK